MNVGELDENPIGHSDCPMQRSVEPSVHLPSAGTPSRRAEAPERQCRHAETRSAPTQRSSEGSDSNGNDASLFPRLVFSRIEADFCVQICIFQHFSRSTRKSSPRKQILQISAKKNASFVKLLIICKKNLKFCRISQIFADFP